MSSFSATARPILVQRRSGWLIASIALNLVLIGLILAWLLNMQPDQPLVSWQRAILSSLDQGDAVIVSDSTAHIADIQRSGDIKVHEQYAKLRGVLQVQPFDRTAADGILTEIGSIRNDQQSTIGHIFGDELAGLSAAGRETIKKAMERKAQRWHAPPGH